MKKRLKFCRKHAGKSVAQWKNFLQAVGDFKEFTWYPKELQPTFKHLRAPWTYMTDRKRLLPEFQRPKRWYKKADWKKTNDHLVWEAIVF